MKSLILGALLILPMGFTMFYQASGKTLLIDHPYFGFFFTDPRAVIIFFIGIIFIFIGGYKIG